MNQQTIVLPSAPLEWLGTAARLFIGGYIIFAALPKIVAPYEFATNISHYEMLPHFLVNAFALIIPWIELIAASMLIVGYRTRTAAITTAVMLVMFTIAVTYAWQAGLEIDCGCFGEGNSEKVGLEKVLKNLGLIIGCIWLAMKPRTAIDSTWIRERIAD